MWIRPKRPPYQYPLSIYSDLCNIFFPGANTGIGKETALDLAKRGARLILLCRNVDKAKKAAEHIKKTHNGAQIAVHQLDLASLKSVRNCAQTLIDTEDKIDILVNNAGEINFIYYEKATKFIR